MSDAIGKVQVGRPEGARAFPGVDGRKAYSRPTIACFGDVRDETLGSSTGQQDSGGSEASEHAD